MLLIKKINLAALSLVSLASIGSAFAAATDSQSFSATGNIISRNCSISMPNTTVTFDNIQITDIAASSVVPNTNNQQFIDIELSCPSETHVALSVLGNTDQNDHNALAIDTSASGSAKNVAVAFWDNDANYTLMPLNSGSSAAIDVPAGNIATSHLLRSALVQADTSQGVVAGTINASAQVKIVYL